MIPSQSSRPSAPVGHDASPRRQARLALLSVLSALVVASGVGACSFNDVPGLQLPTAPLDTTTPRAPMSIQTWLDTTSATVRSIDFGDTDFSDLIPVRDAIGSSRIVMLGEQSGLDGTTFRAKARLVRYLHEQLGFDVLVFESGLYDMQAAWARIEDGGSASDAARASVSAAWRNSAELQPLFAFVEQRARSARPLRLAGVTPEFTGPAATGTRTAFAADLESYLTRSQSLVPSSAWWPAFRAAVQRLSVSTDANAAPDSADRAALAIGFPLLRAETNRLVNVGSEVEAGFWITAVLSLETQFRLRIEPLTPEQRGNLRDSSMAESLVWLAQARYPDRKLIVWTSSAASLRSPRELFTPAGAPDGHERAVLGTLARTAIGDVIFSIGFLAGTGSYGPVAPSVTSPVRPLVPPLPESWDGLFLATGKPFAFLHLRREASTANDLWVLNPRVARAINYQQSLARWPLVYDAFFFTSTMAPATARP